MSKNRSGFTLMELLVVVIIIGILASVGVPHYYKTVETTRAEDALSIGHMLGNAYRMFKIDNPGFTLGGQITTTCNSGNCIPLPGDLTGCRIVRCGYVATQDWSNSSYNYFVGEASCGGNMACVRRNGGTAPYSGWGYNFSAAGACTPVGVGTPACPKF